MSTCLVCKSNHAHQRCQWYGGSERHQFDLQTRAVQKITIVFCGGAAPIRRMICEASRFGAGVTVWKVSRMCLPRLRRSCSMRTSRALFSNSASLPHKGNSTMSTSVFDACFAFYHQLWSALTRHDQTFSDCKRTIEVAVTPCVR